MAITSTDIQTQSFSIDRKGYDVDEVDVFLERVASELDEMNSLIADLQAQLESAKQKVEEAQAEALKTTVLPAAASSSEEMNKSAVTPLDMSSDEKDARIAELETKLEAKTADDNAIAQALITAQRSGDEIVSNAKKTAETTRRDAEEEAKRILDKANNEKQRIIENIQNLQSDREEARQQYQEMLKDYISGATKRLSEIGGEFPVYNSGETTGRVAGGTAGAVADLDPITATYTTPTINTSVAAPAAPKPSKPEKDLSGFGDADDDFEFGDLD